MEIFLDLCNTYSFINPKEISEKFLVYKSMYIPKEIVDEKIIQCYQYSFFYAYTKLRVKIKSYCNGKIKERVFKSCLKEVKSNIKNMPANITQKKTTTYICNLYSLYKNPYAPK